MQATHKPIAEGLIEELSKLARLGEPLELGHIVGDRFGWPLVTLIEVEAFSDDDHFWLEVAPETLFQLLQRLSARQVRDHEVMEQGVRLTPIALRKTGTFLSSGVSFAAKYKSTRSR